MNREYYLKECIDSIKKTDEMISLHKANNGSALMINQYEAIKAKQISELIDSLAVPPYQTIEGISMIKKILDKFYPNLPADTVKLKELKELENAIY
jgi:hypothetical protein